MQKKYEEAAGSALDFLNQEDTKELITPEYYFYSQVVLIYAESLFKASKFDELLEVENMLYEIQSEESTKNNVLMTKLYLGTALIYQDKILDGIYYLMTRTSGSYDTNENFSVFSNYIGSETGTEDAVVIEQVLNPNVINIFQDYKLQTPSKITGSGALVFKKIGLLSFDYSIKDYSSIKFKPSDDIHFIEQNSRIANTLDQAISYKIGAEILQNRISYRAGYKFEENPRGLSSHDLTGFSFGLGYKINNSRIDLSFEKQSLKA